MSFFHGSRISGFWLCVSMALGQGGTIWHSMPLPSSRLRQPWVRLRPGPGCGTRQTESPPRVFRCSR